jgi:hypothetical protein
MQPAERCARRRFFADGFCSKKDKSLSANKMPHIWTGKEKGLYFVSLIPFLTLMIGALYVLATYSIYVSLVYVGIYLLTNIFQAGCCVGCPYRGRYCPAFCGVYLGNWFSSIFYKDRRYDEKFFTRNAAAGEIMLLLFLLFPLYWLYQTAWYFAPVYVILFGIHVILFAPTQCEKCGYNTICPGGNAWISCKKMFTGNP